MINNLAVTIEQHSNKYQTHWKHIKAINVMQQYIYNQVTEDLGFPY